MSEEVYIAGALFVKSIVDYLKTTKFSQMDKKVQKTYETRRKRLKNRSKISN
jgi:hypothetical protein